MDAVKKSPNCYLKSRFIEVWKAGCVARRAYDVEIRIGKRFFQFSIYLPEFSTGVIEE